MEIQLKCNECRQTLDGVVQGGILYVDLCPACAKQIEAKAYEEGYRDGLKDGEERGENVDNKTQRAVGRDTI